MRSSWTLMVGMSLAVAGCDNDARIERRVEEKLATVGLAAIDVSVEDGVASLSGEVDEQADRARAENAARVVPGVRWVENRILIPLRPDAEDVDVTGRREPDIDRRGER